MSEQGQIIYIYVFLHLSLLHCILFDHSSENKMLKHSVLVLVAAGCKILSAFWTLNILVMSEEQPTNFHQPNFSRSTNKEYQTNFAHLYFLMPPILT